MYMYSHIGLINQSIRAPHLQQLYKTALATIAQLADSVGHLCRPKWQIIRQNLIHLVHIVKARRLGAMGETKLREVEQQKIYKIG